MKNKKIIVSLCAVALFSVGAGTILPSAAAHAENSTTVSTTVSDPTDEFNGTVNLVDESGKVLGQTSVLKGKIGDHVAITLPTGYVAVSNGATTIDYVLNKDKTPIKIRKIGDVEVTRTINLHQPDGSVKTVKQTTKAGQEFAQYTVPTIKYYKTSVSVVPSETAKAGSNEVVDVTYTRSLPDWTVGVDGYDVVAAGPITRTINFVDENGNKLAESKVETVNREVLVKQGKLSRIYKDYIKANGNVSSTTTTGSLSTATAQSNLSTTAQDAIKDNKADGYLVLGLNGDKDKTNILDPAYKLENVKAPKIKGYTLKDKKLANIVGQYLWLSTPQSLSSNPKLSNGLDEFLTQDTTINVVYTKAGQKNTNKKGTVAAGVVKDNNKGDGSNTGKLNDNSSKLTNGNNSQSESASNGSQSTNGSNSAATNNSSADNSTTPTGNGSNVTSSNIPDSDVSSNGSVDTGSLPQTGNKPTNWLVMGITSALASLGLGVMSARSKKKQF